MTISSIQALETKFAPSPVGPYSQAIKAGEWLYCSGQIALDPSTGLMIGSGDIEKETRQVLTNLFAVLDSAQTTPSKVVKTCIYLVNLNDFQKVNAIYAEFFRQKVSPARACVEVAGLPKGALVEIDCIAWLG